MASVYRVLADGGTVGASAREKLLPSSAEQGKRDHAYLGGFMTDSSADARPGRAPRSRCAIVRSQLDDMAATGATWARTCCGHEFVTSH
ncbi:hypothetical protein ACIBQ1_48915 [Nonomuraea sp. NPDC050153]|uniref:hypothetical protein n=1 Tax=Nonomuraea sp. NPDC050153 TaxID=3364359 RepID=UPI00379C52DD